MNLRFLLLLSLGALPLSAQITQWDVFFTERLTQTSATPVTAADAYAWDYSSRILIVDPGDLASGTATLPSGTVVDLDLYIVYGGFSYLYGRIDYADRAALIAGATPGTYVFEGVGGAYDGFSADLAVPATTELSFPAVLPSFSAETIDALDAGWLPADDFTFAWNFWQVPSSFADPSSIFFRISQNGSVVYDSGALLTDIGGINYAWSTVVAPGTATTIEVFFSQRSLALSASPEGTELIGYDLATSYSFTTAGTIPEPTTVAALCGLAALGVAGLHRHRRRS